MGSCRTRCVRDGIEELRRGIAAYDATGTRLWRAQSLGVLAQALKVSGDHQHALEAVVAALEIVRETGEDGGVADLHRLQGDILLARAGADMLAISIEVEECLTRALTVAREQGARSWELRAATSMARLRLQQNKTTAARRLMTPVVEWFTEGADTADLKAARATLIEASGRTSQPA
jgi:predicted ATPase